MTEAIYKVEVEKYMKRNDYTETISANTISDVNLWNGIKAEISIKKIELY